MMSAACVKARRMRRTIPATGRPITLADRFCRHARRRIAQRFDELFDNEDSVTHKLARGVLEGRYTWLEEGVVGLNESYRNVPMTEPVEVS